MGIKQLAKALLSTERLLRLTSGNRFIFTYHDIGSPGAGHHSFRNATPLALFQEHLDLIGRLFQVVSLDELSSNKKLGRGNFATITFDAGFKSVYTDARPLLRAARMPYAVFINGAAVTKGQNWITNMEMNSGDRAYLLGVLSSLKISDIGQPDLIDHVIAKGMFTGDFPAAYHRSPPDPPLYMDRTEVSELHNEGVTLGDHTWDHVVLSRCDDRTLMEQLRQGVDLLRSIRGTHSVHHAIPFGMKKNYDQRSLRRLRSAGFTRIYTTNPYRFTRSDAADNRFLIPRIGVVRQTVQELLFHINRTLLWRYDL
ncbi:MAG: polysaccharide deacetylase family protein [Flavobacteriales bacterium]|nr:polysaccharide deacetylase family protein [Flavobacteriales bacterium]